MIFICIYSLFHRHAGSSFYICALQTNEFIIFLFLAAKTVGEPCLPKQRYSRGKSEPFYIFLVDWACVGDIHFFIVLYVNRSLRSCILLPQKCLVTFCCFVMFFSDWYHFSVCFFQKLQDPAQAIAAYQVQEFHFDMYVWYV